MRTYTSGLPSQQKEDVAFTLLGVDGTAHNVEFDTSVSFGGRVGYWRETPPYPGANLNLGLALDVFHFQPDIGFQSVPLTPTIPGFLPINPIDITVTAISLDAMFRWQLLTSPEFPKGRVQPYFTVGPMLVIAEAKDSTNSDPPNQSDTDVTVGLKVGVGLAWHLLKNVAVFGEYRFTFFSPEFEFFDVALGPVTAEADVFTHHFVAGIGYRF